MHSLKSLVPDRLRCSVLAEKPQTEVGSEISGTNSRVKKGDMLRHEHSLSGGV